ncbi:hypothetical protein [Streptomyces spectabilis]|uniref:Uncharacterized protein n=1 Tax=Streptomyces spectabilis TaxID=68270 RepID=A0A7W8B664_STRST|nr:hypothetical protein [Streptomyces spectabilis]MBB5109313.1 hypothetical protein [Streptomyces spectabilis]GGV52375.1 hypothetical protein GCM10010245_82420 [Streptomyces spectabilis]
MTDNQQAAPSAPDDTAFDRPLTLSVLRRLIRQEWRGLPGTTLVVLARDPEGNGFSPFAAYDYAQYSPDDNGLVGDIYPSPEDLEKEAELRELFPAGIPDSAVPALVLVPLG